MATWEIVLLVYLGVVLLAGVGFGVAEHYGWIKNKRLRRLLRKVYGLDRKPNDDDQNEDDSKL